MFLRQFILIFSYFFLLINNSFANCDDSDHITKFIPSNLGIDSTEILVKQNIDIENTKYNITYKGQSIVLLVGNQHLPNIPKLFGRSYNTIKLDNLNTEMYTGECADMVCASSTFSSDNGYIIFIFYQTTKDNLLIGEEFMKSLTFIPINNNDISNPSIE